MEFDYKKEPRGDILCIDVKSFFASAECIERGFHPLEKMLVVMSHAENAGGLILSASPMAKKQLGIQNVSRKFELPRHPDLLIVPPRMSLYANLNVKINDIYRSFVSEEDLLIYSIDESFLNVTKSHLLFGKSTYEIAQKIQKKVREETGLYVTIGIGDNPLLAKLAMDNEAKKTKEMIAEWRYEDVPNTVWKIAPISNMWGIGFRMEKRLARIGIDSVYTLAKYDYHLLKKNLGVAGEQLWANAWGIDRSDFSKRYTPLEKSYGNSQILARDYEKQREIEIVIREMADQVAARLRAHHCQTRCIHLYIRFSHFEVAGGFSHQMAIPATSSSKELAFYCITLFRKYYKNEAVRQIGISYSRLLTDEYLQINLFDSTVRQAVNRNLDKMIDTIRVRYGFSALVRGSSLSAGSTAVYRSTLLGGHRAGE